MSISIFRRMTTVFFAMAILSLGLLTGCTESQGTSVNELQTEISSIKDGQTTEKQLIAALGQPYMVKTNLDGTETLGWMGAQEHQNALLLLTAVGVSAGHSYHSRTLDVVVKNGVVISHTIVTNNQ